MFGKKDFAKVQYTEIKKNRPQWRNSKKFFIGRDSASTCAIIGVGESEGKGIGRWEEVREGEWMEKRWKGEWNGE